MISSLKLFFHALLVLLISAKTVDFYDGLRNDKSQMVTYLTGVVEKHVIKVEVENSGSKAAGFYLIAIPKSKSPNFSFLRVSDLNAKKTLSSEKVSVNFDEKAQASMSNEPENFEFFAAKFSSPLKSGSKIGLKITFGFMHVLSPLPASIKKTGKQFVVYEKGNQNFISPYLTRSETAGFSLASDKVRSYTKPARLDGKTIRYGPSENTQPLTLQPVRIHFQFHVPFLTITQAKRDFELSHWGNVRIEESYLLKHDGAKLKGPYEPNSYMRMLGRGDPAAVHELRAMLPKTAYGVYYRDRIGNISTSTFRTGTHKSILEIRPRYPLYGGWKTDFTIGYDVPSQTLIKVNPKTSEHLLNISFGVPFREPVTDQLIIKVALPEGASDVQVDCPYEVEQIEARRFTYLDTLSIGGGRPLLIFKKKNVVHLHNQNLVISYKYSKNHVYHKVFLVCGGILMFYLTMVIMFRIDFSLDDSATRSSKSGRSGATTESMGEVSEVIANLSETDHVDRVLKQLKGIRFSVDGEMAEEIEKAIENLEHAKSKAKKVLRKVLPETITRLKEKAIELLGE